MPTLEIDGKSVTVADGLNLIQAAEQLGIEIPHYCYHPGLTVAGNCRMCLVEIEKMPKLQIACNTRVAEGMVVRTQSDRVKHVRASVLEFLLLNHPIDCPICDQAGECKLQDYYMDYDRQASRVPVEEKVHKGKAIDIGNLVMLDQERCILCTRCVRFLDEVTKTSELGVFQRGDHCQIDTFPEKRVDNPYSGNIVDICPVGALTNKDFRFKARVWYLDHTPSICTRCATGCNIDVHHRRGQVFRYRPRENDAVNRYWMCDEGRLSYKQLQGERRLLRAMVRQANQWVATTPDAAIDTVAARLRVIRDHHDPHQIGALISARASNEEVYLFARLFRDGLRGAQLAGVSWSPADAYHDAFLIDGDRNPNTSGVHAFGLGTDATAVLDAVDAGSIKALVVYRTDLAALRGEAWLDRVAEQLEFLVVIDTDGHPTAEAADVLLPIATHVETVGTFTNRQRRVQLARQALIPPGQVQEGWLVLSDLGRRVAGWELHPSAEAVFRELSAHTPAFAGLDYGTIGLHGAELGA
ncbi:MAG TPA: 2Fe-2S iron-sulfur cluster-binding protein [Candidatus Binatia bacterium]|nr:2Fe-2S iron-sulfur cluster-binding protein [Candidatus Binatia bacterium]